jgi:hypothetical protein
LELANAQRTQTPAPDVEPAWIKAHIERLYELLRKDPARAKREMTKHLDGDPAISPLPGNPGEQRAEITGRVKPDSLLALNEEAAEFRLLSDRWLRGRATDGPKAASIPFRFEVSRSVRRGR